MIKAALLLLGTVLGLPMAVQQADNAQRLYVVKADVDAGWVDGSQRRLQPGTIVLPGSRATCAKGSGALWLATVFGSRTAQFTCESRNQSFTIPNASPDEQGRVSLLFQRMWEMVAGGGPKIDISTSRRAEQPSYASLKSDASGVDVTDLFSTIDLDNTRGLSLRLEPVCAAAAGSTLAVEMRRGQLRASIDPGVYWVIPMDANHAATSGDGLPVIVCDARCDGTEGGALKRVLANLDAWPPTGNDHSLDAVRRAAVLAAAQTLFGCKPRQP